MVRSQTPTRFSNGRDDNIENAAVDVDGAVDVRGGAGVAEVGDATCNNSRAGAR